MASELAVADFSAVYVCLYDVSCDLNQWFICSFSAPFPCTPTRGRDLVLEGASAVPFSTGTVLMSQHDRLEEAKTACRVTVYTGHQTPM